MCADQVAMEIVFPALTHGQQHMKNIDLELVNGSVLGMVGVSTCPFRTLFPRCLMLAAQTQGRRAWGVCGGC